MYKRFFIVLITTLAWCGSSQAQPDLREGAVLTPSVRMYLQSVVPEENLKGPVLVEFWNTTCLSCIQSFAKLDSLQGTFRSQLQIVLVTSEPRAKVDAFWKRVSIKKPAVTWLHGDTLLSKAFPYNSVPHVIWLRSDTVCHITYGSSVDRSSLAAFVARKPLLLTRKDDFPKKDFRQPLWTQREGRQGLIGYSFFSERDSLLPPGKILSAGDTGHIGWRLINKPLVELYALAFGEDFEGPYRYRNRQLFSEDATYLQMPRQALQLQAWRDQTSVSYEIYLPKEKQTEWFARMREDLQRYFPFEAGVVSLSVPCLVFTFDSANASLRSNGGPSQERAGAKGAAFYNATFAAFVSALNQANQDWAPPILDETGIAYPIDLPLTSSLSDWQSLQAELQQKGILMHWRQRTLSFLQVRKKDTALRPYP